MLAPVPSTPDNPHPNQLPPITNTCHLPHLALPLPRFTVHIVGRYEWDGGFADGGVGKEGTLHGPGRGKQAHRSDELVNTGYPNT